MDSDLLGILFAIIISAIIAWVERVGKKAKASAPKGVQASVPAQERQRQGMTASVPPQERQRQRVQSPVPPQGSAELPEEGARVTVDIDDAPALTPTPAVQRPASLRDAIIWGEILRRKF